MVISRLGFFGIINEGEIMPSIKRDHRRLYSTHSGLPVS
jgi:hypothetical protein